MRNLTLDETKTTKKSFEKATSAAGHEVEAYCADNGVFTTKGFKDDLGKLNQDITFCAVGAHHQNALVERRIKELTLGARVALLHAKRMWPEIITTML